MTRAIGYLRTATSPNRAGLEAQRAAVVDWAQRAGLEVVEWFEDEGVSGLTKPTARPGFSAALRALEPADVLVVARPDRLARSLEAARGAEGLLSQRGALLVSATT